MTRPEARPGDVVSAEGLCMRYRTKDVLRDVSFRVGRGKAVALLGPFEARPRRPEIMFRHRGSVGSVALEARDESSGTLRLLDLAGRILPILGTGGLILVDEIDASLHPLLTATLVHLFQSPTANTNHAQLVFTTHDATLLGSIDGEDVLRRDEVWFTGKGNDGASELFPLAEFKPRRQGENRQKRYLNGSYGAIPELSMELFERAVTSRADARAK